MYEYILGVLTGVVLMGTIAIIEIYYLKKRKQKQLKEQEFILETSWWKLSEDSIKTNKTPLTIVKEYYFKKLNQVECLNITDYASLVKVAMKLIRTGHLLKIKNLYYELDDEYVEVEGGYIKTGAKIVQKSTDTSDNETISLDDFKKEIQNIVISTCKDKGE